MNLLRQTQDDPFYYGYRSVERTDERGRITLDVVPLTEDDVLHPQLEDHVTQNEPHNQDVRYIQDACEAQVAGQPDTVVLGDHRIVWDVQGIRPHGPDVAVVLGASRGQRSSFDVAQEGVRPELIIEVTSPATRNSDLNTKPRQYWRCRVPYFVIVDELPRRRQQQRQLRLIGYERGKRGYRRMPLDSQGRLWLPTVQMWLGHENGRVVCYDQQGKPIPRYMEEKQARLQAEQALQQAEAEVTRLKKRLRELGDNP
jgi:colicin import membrane protein